MLGQASLGGTVTLSSVKDGTSSTAIFSEYIRGKRLARQHGLSEIYTDTTDPNSGTYIPLTPLLTHCNAAAAGGATSTVTTKGADWMDQAVGGGGGYTHIQTPNKTACLFSDAALHTDHGIIGPSSHHPGGVNLVMLDGAVKFIKDSINHTTWWAIGTHRGGETVDTTSY
jgi:prepilin-type processing-associated H-X9-DG protein